MLAPTPTLAAKERLALSLRPSASTLVSRMSLPAESSTSPAPPVGRPKASTPAAIPTPWPVMLPSRATTATEPPARIVVTAGFASVSVSVLFDDLTPMPMLTEASGAPAATASSASFAFSAASAAGARPSPASGPESPPAASASPTPALTRLDCTSRLMPAKSSLCMWA